jgi:transposase-like protein
MSILSTPFFHDEPPAVAKLETIIWPNGPVCVHCGEANRIGRLNGKSTKIGTLKCYACKKKFSATVGTVFEDSHVPVHQWLQAVYLICSSKKGFSSHQMMRTMDVQYKTAWFMTHRIREAMTEGDWRTIGPLGAKARPLRRTKPGLAERLQTGHMVRSRRSRRWPHWLSVVAGFGCFMSRM